MNRAVSFTDRSLCVPDSTGNPEETLELGGHESG